MSPSASLPPGKACLRSSTKSKLRELRQPRRVGVMNSNGIVLAFGVIHGPLPTACRRNIVVQFHLAVGILRRSAGLSLLIKQVFIGHPPLSPMSKDEEGCNRNNEENANNTSEDGRHDGL